MKEIYPKCKTCGQREMPTEIMMKEFACLTLLQPHTPELRSQAVFMVHQHEKQQEAGMWRHMHMEMERLRIENDSLREKYEPQAA
jgi:hypothetical protein